jgi:hypothetical protein
LPGSAASASAWRDWSQMIWWVMEWSCTKTGSGDVCRTPNCPWVVSVSLGTAFDQPIATSSGRQSAGLEVDMRQVGCAGLALVGCGVELYRNRERGRVLHS